MYLEVHQRQKEDPQLNLEEFRHLKVAHTERKYEDRQFHQKTTELYSLALASNTGFTRSLIILKFLRLFRLFFFLRTIIKAYTFSPGRKEQNQKILTE